MTFSLPILHNNFTAGIGRAVSEGVTNFPNVFPPATDTRAPAG